MPEQIIILPEHPTCENLFEVLFLWYLDTEVAMGAEVAVGDIWGNNWHMLHSTWYQVHGNWHLAPGTCYLVLGPWHMAHGT